MKAHAKPLLVIAVASLLGASFAYVSTADFVAHLDRQVHPLHCSFVPGASVEDDDEASGCLAAMVSPYSSFFRRSVWGGLPISLLALGTFAFLLAFAGTLLVAPPREERRAAGFLALAALIPLLATGIYFTLAVARVGELCKVCIGIYSSSIIIAGAVVWLFRRIRKERPIKPELRPSIWWIGWAAELGMLLALPLVVYVLAMPRYDRAVTSCGRLERTDDHAGVLAPLRTSKPRVPAVFVVDPLCPACRALHERLEQLGEIEALGARMLLFPLDSSCNWMLDRPRHPGACVMSRAVLCAGDDARRVLEFAYEHQADLTALGRRDEAALQRRVAVAFPDLSQCMRSRQSKKRLEDGLQWAVDNHLPVLTPQLYLDGRRLCDEDTDVGLDFALDRLQPRGASTEARR